MDKLWILIFLFGYLSGARAQTTDAVTTASAKTPAQSKQVLNITTIPTAPYVMRNRDDDGFEGFIPDVLDRLADVLAFDYNLYLPSDGKYGSPKENATGWTGMMGEVVNGNADIALPLTVSMKRSTDVDFTYPLQSADPAIVLKRPQKQSPSVTDSLIKLLVPMEFPVWLMTVLAFLVTSTVLYIISHTNPYEWRRMAKDKEATLREAESFTCLNTFWFIISTLAWQGYVRAPRSMGGRITVTAWWFFVLIFILSYTASLTNYLRVGPDPQEAWGYSRIQSFRDLANNDDVSVAMVSDGHTAQSFRTSPDQQDQKLYKKFVEFEKNNEKLESYYDGIRFLREMSLRDVALVMEAPSAKFVVHRKPCDLFMVRDPRTSRFISMAVKKSSPLLEKLNLAVLKMYETGEMSDLERRWFESKVECGSSVVEKPHGDATYKVPPFYVLDLGTFSGALLILVCGLVLGGLVTIIELCIYKSAELHPDEEEPTANQIGQNDLNTSEHLLSGETKRGGATQV